VFASPSSLALAAGQTAQLVATTYDVNGDPIQGRSISWSSSNSSVATVSSSGLVTTIARATRTSRQAPKAEVDRTGHRVGRRRTSARAVRPLSWR
jgi:uncharacterized protein YjdB